MKNSEALQACGKPEWVNWLLMKFQLQETGAFMLQPVTAVESCSPVLQLPHMVRGW